MKKGDLDDIGLTDASTVLRRYSTNAVLRPLESINRLQRAINPLGKLMDQYQPIFEESRLGSIAAQYQMNLISNQLEKSVEKYRALLKPISLGNVLKPYDSIAKNQLGKAIEQYQNIIGNNSLGRIAEQYRSILDTNMVGSAFSRYQSILKESNIEKTLKALSVDRSILEGATLKELLSELNERHSHIDEVIESDMSSSVIAGERDEKSTVIVDSESKALEKNNKKDSLSLLPTWLLQLLIFILLGSATILENWESVRESIVDINARIPKTESFYEVRNFIRTELGGRPGDMRIVSGENVNLRMDPGMQSEIIMQLPKNSLVAVLGKEDRKWLLVSYESNGYFIDGYVSTKFLKRIRK